jgi:hypothetical protein
MAHSSNSNGVILDNIGVIEIPKVSKAEKTALRARQGTLVYDTDAKKLSIKTEDADVIASWENITSVNDA